MVQKKKAIITATTFSLAAALLAGGTFALWSDTETVGGASITNGNLDIAVTAPAAAGWTDTSYVAKPGDPVTTKSIANISNFRLVPGDSVKGSYTLTGKLEGDNLRGTLALDASTGATLPAGVTVGYVVKDGKGTAVESGTLTGGKATLNVASAEYLASDAHTADTAKYLSFSKAGTSYTIETTVTFASATNGTTSVTSAVKLGDMKLTLTQAR